MEVCGESRREKGPFEGRGGDTPEWCLGGPNGLAGEAEREASCLRGLCLSKETISNTT